MQQDGIIDKDEFSGLLHAVDEISSPSKKPEDHTKILLDEESMASLMLPCMGYTNHVKRKRSPKRRGCFDEAEPDNGTLLDTLGVDANFTLSNPAFDCRGLGGCQEDIAVITYGFMHPVNFTSRYEIDPKLLASWLQAIQDQYISTVPYHNWMHAFDVFQFCFLMLTFGGMSAWFNFQDAMSILIAAIAHDVGHPGTNNAFHVKTGTSLAIRYNDKSPLENMHASRTFETMLQSGNNFLEQMNAEDFANVRTKIIDAILETDPSRHFEFVGKLTTQVENIERYKDLPEDVDAERKKVNVADRRLLLRGVVHAADIGNAFRPWNIYKNLVASLEEEFFMQGDRERQLGVPVSPLMDRTKDSLAGGQDFFLGKLVSPLFTLYEKFLCDELRAIFEKNMEDNKGYWKHLMDRHGKKTAGELLSLDEAISA
jgi:hypothetical protein